MTALISVKMRNIQFEGQTKTKLGNSEARTALEAITTEQLIHFIENTTHEHIIRLIIEKAIKAAKVREAARKAREITRKKNSLEGAPLVGKLASCTGRDVTINELFIVEGDSAGGSAKQGRDRRFQAILPLRQALECGEKAFDWVLANEEFRTIISALGTGYDEILTLIILSTTRSLFYQMQIRMVPIFVLYFLTFFFRYMKELITEGHVYIGLSSLDDN